MTDGPAISAKVTMTFEFAEGRWEMRLSDTGEFWVIKGKKHPAYGDFTKTTPTEAIGRISPEDFEDGMRAYRAMKACMGETKGLIRAREDKEREDARYVEASLEATRLQEEASEAAKKVGAILIYKHQNNQQEWRDFVAWGSKTPQSVPLGSDMEQGIEADMPLRAEPGQENEFAEIPPVAPKVWKTREDVIKDVAGYAVERITEILERSR